MHPGQPRTPLLTPRERVSDLPQYQPDFLIDVEAINRKYAARKGDPRRVWTGTFQSPKDASKTVFESSSKEKCNRFVDAIGKRGWDLVSGLKVYGPFVCYDIRDKVLLLGTDEYRVSGVFRLRKPKPVRTEIPVGLVRQLPEQNISLEEANSRRS